MKNARQEKILEIIESMEIETQNQLIDALRSHGFNSTQATVSRDMRELRLVKELSESGGYKYVAPAESPVHECVTSVSCAQNLIVIKTLPGLAPAACSAIDSMDIKELVGSIAGDDTGFLAMTDNDAAHSFCDEMRAMMK